MQQFQSLAGIWFYLPHIAMNILLDPCDIMENECQKGRCGAHSYEWLLTQWIRRAKPWGLSLLCSCARSWQLPATEQNQACVGWQPYHRSARFVHGCSFLWHIKPYSPQETSTARWSRLCSPQYLELLKPMEIYFHTFHLLRIYSPWKSRITAAVNPGLSFSRTGHPYSDFTQPFTVDLTILVTIWLLNKETVQWFPKNEVNVHVCDSVSRQNFLPCLICSRDLILNSSVLRFRIFWGGCWDFYSILC